MSFLRRHLLALVLALCAAGIGVEVWQLSRARQAAERALAALAQAAQERDWLAGREPAPSAESEQAIAAELAAIRARIGTLRQRLQPRTEAGTEGTTSSRSLDAYFEIASLVEKARAQAIAARVSLRPEERFGFAAYANEGPAPAQLAAVQRQERAVQQLLGPLFESRPLALLGIRRQQPATGAGSLARGGEDFFSPEPAVSLQRPGLIETEALRLEFTGQTSTLRAFLNGLTGLADTVVVRSVEVEPVAPAGSRRPAGGADATVPVVRQSLSRFAVTVEFIHLAGNPTTPAS